MEDGIPDGQTTLERIGQTTLERIGRGMKSRLFGRSVEKAFRQRNADEFNYGGRKHTPDPDIADPAPIADEVEAVAHADAGPRQTPLFSSPLPDHAFRTGDLDEDFLSEEGDGRSVRSMRPARSGGRRRFGGIFTQLFTRH